MMSASSKAITYFNVISGVSMMVVGVALLYFASEIGEIETQILGFGLPYFVGALIFLAGVFLLLAGWESID